MRTHGEMSLEKYRFFPIVAWVLFIGFALFVANLALELYNLSDRLSEDGVRLQVIVNENSSRLDMLEAELERLSNER